MGKEIEPLSQLGSFRDGFPGKLVPIWNLNRSELG